MAEDTVVVPPKKVVKKKSFFQKMKALRARGKDLSSYETARKKNINKSVADQVAGTSKKKKKV